MSDEKENDFDIRRVEVQPEEYSQGQHLAVRILLLSPQISVFGEAKAH